jgi:hypothetical protein
MMTGIFQDLASGKMVLFSRLKWFSCCSAISIIDSCSCDADFFDENATTADEKETYGLKLYSKWGGGVVLESGRLLFLLCLGDLVL